MKHSWKKPVLIITGVLVLTAIVIFATDRKNVKYQFPIWREAVEQKGTPVVNPKVTLTIDGIDFRVDSEGKSNDVLHVTAEAAADSSYGVSYWVDYLYQGKWYTVYDASTGIEPAKILSGPDKNTLEYQVPAGLFKQKGQYRLYIDSLGYCEIDLSAAAGGAP